MAVSPNSDPTISISKCPAFSRSRSSAGACRAAPDAAGGCLSCRPALYTRCTTIIAKEPREQYIDEAVELIEGKRSGYSEEWGA